MRFSAKSQASLELAVAMVCVWLLVFGIFRAFFWLNERMVYRQEDYEGTSGSGAYGRVAAASADGYVGLREDSDPRAAERYQPLDLSLLK